jgi:hypothetical protein
MECLTQSLRTVPTVHEEPPHAQFLTVPHCATPAASGAAPGRALPNSPPTPQNEFSWPCAAAAAVA